MKKIVVILTGGTIAMRMDPNLMSAVPSLSKDELLGDVKKHINGTIIEERELYNVPSPHMNAKRMVELRDKIIEALNEDDVIGVIVTHGTDTLEESAFYINTTVESKKPIVFTGAMRNASELGYDGELNITASIATIISYENIYSGTYVVMNNEIHSAYDVTKTNTLSVNTFKSLDFGPLGIIDNDEVIFLRDERKHKKVITENLEEKVALVKIVAGMNSDILNFLVEKEYRGIVIEALGRGNVPPEVVSGLENAIKKNIPIVMVSRCGTGRVLGSYGYVGGGKRLLDMGVINGGYLTGQKARIALMALLDANKDYNQIKEYFKL